METKQTAVEWLQEKVIVSGFLIPQKFIEQAKQMEKEQIIDADNMRKKKKKEEKRRKEFSEWFSKAWDASINSPDKHAEDWNY